MNNFVVLSGEKKPLCGFLSPTTMFCFIDAFVKIIRTTGHDVMSVVTSLSVLFSEHRVSRKAYTTAHFNFKTVVITMSKKLSFTRGLCSLFFLVNLKT